MATEIEVGVMEYKQLNEEIRDAIADGENDFSLTEVYGQRYIGTALQSPVHIKIDGTPGNDMASFMDGCSIEVFGNAQDQTGNTMNDGEIIIHGRCGDATGYGMRGGAIFVRDSCGWRNGIHMKEYKEKRPVLVVGGDAGSFLGEYMAGGVILLLGKPGEYLATGMHGGVIYLANPIAAEDVNEQLVQEELDEYDKEFVANMLERYNSYFGTDKSLTENFRRLRPKSSRPYGGMYT